MSDYEQHMTGTLPVLPVSNVEVALNYYVERLGFSAVFNQANEQGEMVNAQIQMDGCHIMLNLNPDDANQKGGGIYLWIRVAHTDIDSLYKQIANNKVNIVEPIADQFWGDRSFVVEDQLGYRIAFTQALSEAQTP